MRKPETVKPPPTPPDRGADVDGSPPFQGGKGSGAYQGGLNEDGNTKPPSSRGEDLTQSNQRGFQHTRELKDGYGFDAVIGNPPYVRQESLKSIKSYLKRKYTVYNGIADLYVYFFERSLGVLKPKGLFGYIVANKWLRAKYGKSLRKYLSEKQVENIIDFGDLEVFQGVSTYPCVTIIRNDKRTRPTYAFQPDSLDFNDLNKLFDNNRFEVAQSALSDDRWSLISLVTQVIIDKMHLNSVKLCDYVNGEIYYGIKTGYNKAFIIDEETKHRLIAEDPNSAEIIKPILAGRDIKRYEPLNVSKFLIFTRRGINIDVYPAIKDYLKAFKSELTPKPKNYVGDWSGRKPGAYEWYEIQDTIDYYREFEKPKIIYPNICKKPEFTYDNDKYYTNQKCFIMPGEDKFLLGILNSRLNYFLFMMILPKLRGDYFEPSYAIFKHFPITAINSNNPTDKAKHDKMVQLVETMLELNRQLADSRSTHEKKLISRQIESTDRKIDDLVYDLYDLTPEEIQIVEDSFKK